jgi:hypothetical protein
MIQMRTTQLVFVNHRLGDVATTWVAVARGYLRPEWKEVTRLRCCIRRQGGGPPKSPLEREFVKLISSQFSRKHI